MTPRTPANDEFSPRYWRERAQEAREAARDVHPMNRKILEDVAASYEEMADLMERRDRPKDFSWIAAPDAGEPPASDEGPKALKPVVSASAL